MESSAATVRSHFQNAGTLVTRQQLLAYGSEDAIDSALRELLTRRSIKRVANGVYTLVSSSGKMPSAHQIIEAKAAAFGKRVVTSTAKVCSNEFWTDGCRTAFNSIHGRLKFKTVAPRKLNRITQSKETSQQALNPLTAHTLKKNSEQEIETKIEYYETNSLSSVAHRLLNIINHAGFRLSQIAYAGHWSLESHCLIYDLASGT